MTESNAQPKPDTLAAAEERARLRAEIIARIESQLDLSPAKILDGLKGAWLSTLERASKLVLPGSVALTVAGFVTCSYHFSRRGVPLTALSSAQIVAAGVLYAGLTLAPLILGFSCITIAWPKRAMLGITSAAIVYNFGSMHGTSAGTSAATYYLALFWGMNLIGSGTHREARRDAIAEAADELVAQKLGPAKSPKKSPLHSTYVPQGYGLVVWMWLATAPLFAGLVFPKIPPWLGGGAPRAVTFVWQDSPVSTEDTALGAGSERRCLYEVNSDSSNWYLLTVEPMPDGQCLPPQAFHVSPLRLDNRAVRYVVVPRSRVRIAVYTGASFDN